MKEELAKSFDMKDLSPANQILGMEITRDRKNRRLWLSKERYVEAVKWIFKYLRGISKLCLSFGKGKSVLEGYTDADMADDLDGRKYTYGYIFTFLRGAIS